MSAASPTPVPWQASCSAPRQARMPAGVIREELAAVHPHRRDHAVPAHALGPARARGRCVQPRQRRRAGDGGRPACPVLKVMHLSPPRDRPGLQSMVATALAVSSAWRTGFPSSLRVSGWTGCIPGCTPPPAGRASPSCPARGDQQSAEFLRSSATAWRRRSAATRLSDDGWRGRWITPGILEALIPGRIRGHGGTAEVSGGAA